MNSDKQKCKAREYFFILLIVDRFLVLVNFKLKPYLLIDTFYIYTYPFVCILRNYNERNEQRKYFLL